LIEAFFVIFQRNLLDFALTFNVLSLNYILIDLNLSKTFWFRIKNTYC